MLGRTPPGQRSGFTLVELLLVISIIMVLIGLLLPARSLVDMFIRNRMCESNLKSIHSVFSAYANLNHGDYPLSRTTNGPSHFVGERIVGSGDPWTGLTNVKQLLHCGANDTMFFCPFDTAAQDPSHPYRRTWKDPMSYTVDSKPVYIIFVGYALIAYAGWSGGRPTLNNMLADGRYPIGNVNGGGDIPIVADELYMVMGQTATARGWYHGGGVIPDQGKLDGLFNSDCNTLFNAGYVVHTAAKEFDPRYPAYGSYYCRWFALTR